MLSTLITKSLLHTTDNYIKSLNKGGIVSIGDMLNFYPKDIEDRTNVLENFSYINIKEKNTILVKLIFVDTIRTSNGKFLTKAVFEDKNGFLSEGIWFNRKYLATKLKNFIGNKIILSGKVKYVYGKLTFNSPEVETDLKKSSGEIVPIYSDLNYIPGTWIASKIPFLKNYTKEIQETLPENIIKKYNFISKQEAIYNLHFPSSKHGFDIARERLAYDELFEINYKSISKKIEKQNISEGKSISIPLNSKLVKKIISKLPFCLTDHQKISLFQILKDTQKNHSMSRLLEGDVGTGKTIVALVSIIHLVIQSKKLGNKIQVAIMAPTEILARQHFEGMTNMFFEFQISCDLLVGSTTIKNKKEIKGKLKTGDLDVIIGTHAIVQEDVEFQNLGYVVIDEQHRFGVKQREILENYINLKENKNLDNFEIVLDIKQDDFKEVKNIMRKNEFNKLSINIKDYLLIKDGKKIIGFGRIWKLEKGKYELSNLRVKENYRGKKLGYKLVNFLFKNKYNSKNNELYIACNNYLKKYYANLGFVAIDKYPQRFDSIIEWAKETGKKYIVMKLNKILEIKEFNKSIFLKQTTPHCLNMTATPIPRTLALTLYGDQDLSIISQYPKGRKEIFTKVIKNEKERQQVELFVREQTKSGRQVFWISPLVEESEKMDLANAINTYNSLTQIFSPFKVGLLHGKLKASEKKEIMDLFSKNEIQVLSSTSVVEVGVDVPNATIMCIEGAERFGLSQLHQFRGRVGRGKYKSYCYLFPTQGKSTDRLKAMEKTNNGFELSEIDLEIRGPGEVYGVKQSGIPEFKIADLKDLELISQIREDIEELFEVGI